MFSGGILMENFNGKFTEIKKKSRDTIKLREVPYSSIYQVWIERYHMAGVMT
jgi:hypothetical protein